MISPTIEERPDPDSRGVQPDDASSITNAHVYNKGQPTTVPDDAWRSNWDRMVAKAAANPGFYETAGSGIRRCADELRAGGAA